MPHRNIYPPSRRHGLVPVAFGVMDVPNLGVAPPISHATFGFTSAQLNAADRAVFSTHGNEAHFTWGGMTNHDRTSGFMLEDAAVIAYNVNVKSLHFHGESGGTARVSVLLEKYVLPGSQ